MYDPYSQFQSPTMRRRQPWEEQEEVDPQMQPVPPPPDPAQLAQQGGASAVSLFAGQVTQNNVQEEENRAFAQQVTPASNLDSLQKDLYRKQQEADRAHKNAGVWEGIAQMGSALAGGEGYTPGFFTGMAEGKRDGVSDAQAALENYQRMQAQREQSARADRSETFEREQFEYSKSHDAQAAQDAQAEREARLQQENARIEQAKQFHQDEVQQRRLDRINQAKMNAEDNAAALQRAGMSSAGAEGGVSPAASALDPKLEDIKYLLEMANKKGDIPGVGMLDGRYPGKDGYRTRQAADAAVNGIIAKQKREPGPAQQEAIKRQYGLQEGAREEEFRQGVKKLARDFGLQDGTAAQAPSAAGPVEGGVMGVGGGEGPRKQVVKKYRKGNQVMYEYSDGTREIR